MNEPFPELPFSEDQLEIYRPQIRDIRRKAYEECAVIAEEMFEEGGTLAIAGRAIAVALRRCAVYE